MPKRTRPLTKEEITETLRKHRNDLSKYGVRRIGIFGSYVRNEQGEKSELAYNLLSRCRRALLLPRRRVIFFPEHLS